MSGNESNAGFIGLHTPAGMFLLAVSFLFLIAIIFGGAAFFKAALAKDRESRERLREELEAKKNRSA